MRLGASCFQNRQLIRAGRTCSFVQVAIGGERVRRQFAAPICRLGRFRIHE
jgi:hypothetical protein